MKPRPWWVSAAQFTGIGWYIATAILLPTLLGAWADGKLGTEPLFLLLGLALGIVVGFYGTFKMMSGYLSGSRGPDNERKR